MKRIAVVLFSVLLPLADAHAAGCEGSWPVLGPGQRTMGGLPRYVHDARIRLDFYRVMTGQSLPAVSRQRPLGFGHSWSSWHNRLADLDVALTGSRSSHYSCNKAFAVTVLDRRVEALGADHPYIAFWAENQDRVFQNCGGWGKREPVLPKTPAALPAELAALASDDHRYQSAASFFYARDWAGAMALFRKIAADRASSYRDVARYMVARSLFELGSLNEATAEIDSILADPSLASVHMIAGQYLDIMAYRSRDVDLLERQLRRIDQTLGQVTWQIEVSAESREAYRQAREDLNWFTWVNASADWPDDWWLLDAEVLAPRPEALRRVASQSDLIDWIQTSAAWGQFGLNLPWLARNDPRVQTDAVRRVTEHALAKWREIGGLHWATIAIGRITQDHPAVDDLLVLYEQVAEKTEACPADLELSLSRDRLFYHAVRLHLAKKDIERAFELIAGYPQERNVSSYSPYVRTIGEALVWLIGTGQVEAARRLPEITDHTQDALGQRVAAADLESFLRHIPEKGMTADAAALFNLLPVQVLTELAQSTLLGLDDRAALARVGWTRAHLLGMADARRRLTPILRELNPTLGADLDRAEQAWSERGRDRALLHMIARNPRLGTRVNPAESYWAGRRHNYRVPQAKVSARIPPLEQIDAHNPNDNNWWCRFRPDKAKQEMERQLFDAVMGLSPDRRYPGGHDYWRGDRAALEDNRTRILAQHPVIALIDWDELGAVATIDHGPKYVAEQAVQWAQETSFLDRWLGRDAFLPETLRLAVRTTRYGCQRNGGHGAYSRQAYVELHRAYPDSAAAAKTPYWFDCEHFYYTYQNCRK